MYKRQQHTLWSTCTLHKTAGFFASSEGDIIPTVADVDKDVAALARVRLGANCGAETTGIAVSAAATLAAFLLNDLRFRWFTMDCTLADTVERLSDVCASSSSTESSSSASSVDAVIVLLALLVIDDFRARLSDAVVDAADDEDDEDDAMRVDGNAGGLLGSTTAGGEVSRARFLEWSGS